MGLDVMICVHAPGGQSKDLFRADAATFGHVVPRSLFAGNGGQFQILRSIARFVLCELAVGQGA